VIGGGGIIPVVEKMSINEFYYKHVESFIYTLHTSHKQMHMDGDPDQFALILSHLETKMDEPIISGMKLIESVDVVVFLSD
jgi:hypothetical protein